MKEKFSEEDQKRESFSGVSINFLGALEIKNKKNKKIFQETIEKLKKTVLAYAQLVENMENAVGVNRFELSDDEYRGSVKNMDDIRVVHHETIINLLNLISRLSKNNKWRGLWGTVGTEFERKNLTEWAIEIADYLEKNKNV
ncbi:MAG: DUF3232 domain-containing protein [Patescibacteria group bacterium]